MASQQNYFSLFKLPETYVVDQDLLEQRYRALQRVTHPDCFANASEQEYRLAVQYSSYINQAYATLKSPLLRAQYLLSLVEKTINFNENTQDQDFLLQQIEWRETLEILSENNDQAGLASLNTEIMQSLIIIEKQVCNDFSQQDEQSLNHALQLTNQMQFLIKLQEEINTLIVD